MPQNAPKCPKSANRLNGAILLAAAFSLSVQCLGQPTAGSSQPDSQNVGNRIEQLLKQLTPDEKIDMISGINGFDVRPIERLHIPLLHMSDGPCGTRNDGPTTQYPAPVSLAASWDPDLAKRFGESVGQDARARGVNFWLAPAMNIYRVPQNGRNFEYLGEDPYLASRIVAPIVQGVQSKGVAATLKHFAANNQETERMTISSEVDERALQEIYLPAFKAGVQQGHAWAVMCAYNRLNGIYCSANDWLLDETLKKSWGFTGVVMSDWGAVHDTLGPLNAALDLEMPSGKFFNKEAIQPLLDSGKVAWPTIDDKCRRILRVAIQMGAFDRPQKDESIPLDNPASNETALQIAREGIVLLKNEKHALPLDRAKIKTIAVVGPNAEIAPAGGGSSYTTPTHPVSVLAGLKQIAGDGVNVIAVPSGFERLFDSFVQNATYVQPLSASFYDNRNLQGDAASTQTVEHINFNWTDSPPPLTPKENFSARFSGQIDVKEAGKYLFVMESDDGSRAFVDGKRIMNMWRDHGKEKRMATLDLEPGKHEVTVEYFNAAKDAILRFGWGKTVGVLDDSAKHQLASADAVICCVGFDRDTESEGSDRTFELPYPQDELIQQVTSANPHTILVLNSGGNVDMNPWIDGVPALLHAWYPGQAGGTAIAEILFGDTNPSGKLPQSWEKRFEDNAAFGQVSYPGEAGQVNYHEGIFVGYRHFDHDNIAPRFPFGYGLSYTTFGLKNLKVEPVDGVAGASYQASVDVTNTGDRAGAEVVQLYVGQLQCKTPRPVRELKQFARVELKPHETQTVKLMLNRDAFSYFSMASHSWVVDPGEFEIAVGSSSRDLPLKEKVSVK